MKKEDVLWLVCLAKEADLEVDKEVVKKALKGEIGYKELFSSFVSKETEEEQKKNEEIVDLRAVLRDIGYSGTKVSDKVREVMQWVFSDYRNAKFGELYKELLRLNYDVSEGYFDRLLNSCVRLGYVKKERGSRYIIEPRVVVWTEE